MSKRDVELYIVDILIAINKIERYSKKFTNAQELLYSELEWDAVIRELEIVGEATNSLLKLNFLNQEYRVIVDFRNQINHGYFGIDENIVWEVITSYLKEFRMALFDIIKENNISLNEAIESAKEDNSFNQNILHFLDSLSNEFN